MTIQWKLILLFVGLFAMANPTTAVAQTQEMTREEEKRWKQVAQEYRRNLPGLKTLVEEHDYYQDQNRQLQQQVNDLNSQLSSNQGTVDQLQEQIATLNQRLLTAETAASQPRAAQPGDTSGMGGQTAMTGIVYRVQIGAFERNKMDPSMADSENLTLEESGNLQRVAVGMFRNHSDALTMRDRLRQMGVKDAFVVAYRDGQRIEVNEALQAQGLPPINN